MVQQPTIAECAEGMAYEIGYSLQFMGFGFLKVKVDDIHIDYFRIGVVDNTYGIAWTIPLGCEEVLRGKYNASEIAMDLLTDREKKLNGLSLARMRGQVCKLL